MNDKNMLQLANVISDWNNGDAGTVDDGCDEPFNSIITKSVIKARHKIISNLIGLIKTEAQNKLTESEQNIIKDIVQELSNNNPSFLKKIAAKNGIDADKSDAIFDSIWTKLQNGRVVVEK